MTGKQILEEIIDIKLSSNYYKDPHDLDTLINKRQIIEVLVGICHELDELDKRDTDSSI